MLCQANKKPKGQRTYDTFSIELPSLGLKQIIINYDMIVKLK